MWTETSDTEISKGGFYEKGRRGVSPIFSFGLGPLMGQEKKEMPMKDGMPMKNDSMMGKMKEMTCLNG